MLDFAINRPERTRFFPRSGMQFIVYTVRYATQGKHVEECSFALVFTVSLNLPILSLSGIRGQMDISKNYVRKSI